MELRIEKNSNVPVYMQIVGAVHDAIRRGQLKPGEKLPTVREMATTTGLSKGTIKHAYDELERVKTVEMTQGRGTFILGKVETEITGKKIRALQSIDRMLDELEGLALSPRDIESYVNLKLREREERYDKVRVAFIESSPEIITNVIHQMYTYANVDVVGFLLDEIIYSPHRLDDSFDLILTTETQYDDLVDHISSLREMIVKVALNSTRQTVIQLAGVDIDEGVGVWCQSRNFYTQVIQVACCEFVNLEDKPDVVYLENRGMLEQMLEDKHVLLVPPEHFSFTPPDVLGVIGRFQNNGGRVVVFDHRLERGSQLQLEAFIERIWANKRMIS